MFNLESFTHIVTRAGSAFGFSLMIGTAMVIRWKRGHSLAALRSRDVWLPWALSWLTMIIASRVTGGVIGGIGATFTGGGNQIGEAVGNAAIGQSATGAVEIPITEVMSYGGSWLALLMVFGVAGGIWFAKTWTHRAISLSGAITGATWGISSSLGGWAAMAFVPLASWIMDMVTG